MEIREMSIEQLEARKLELREALEAEGADLDAIETEVRAINEEFETRKSEEAKKVELRQAVAEGEGETIEKVELEERKMDIKELRNSVDYVNKYAEFVKTGNDEELRAALLTANVEGGTIAVPDFVLDIVKTAWDKNDIMSLVPKTEMKGNLKVTFEISGSDAVVHTEGTGAVAEEDLVEGTVTLVPAFVKKWKSISDEVMSLRGEAFLRYIYEELTHKIVKKLADQLVSAIVALPTSATSTSPAAAKITEAPALGVIAKAVANLSDEANKPVVVMNKLTFANFKAVQYAANYAADPFEGIDVHFSSVLPAYDAADAGDVYMIVGDFNQGALANFPNGDSVEFTFDTLTRKKEDLIEILGKEYVASGVVANKAFTNVVKPSAE